MRRSQRNALRRLREAAYSIHTATPEVVFIVDENGPLSVTNDAERVTAEVAAQFPGRRIVYKDSMGNWDELQHDNGEFIGYAPWRKDPPAAKVTLTRNEPA